MLQVCVLMTSKLFENEKCNLHHGLYDCIYLAVVHKEISGEGHSGTGETGIR
jgi:hypothetical protein